MILMMALSSILPAQDRRDYPLPSSGNVTLPLDEYNKLVELASKPEKKLEIPPISYAIKHAELKLRVASESVSGTVQCDGEIFTKGISTIPLMNTPAVLNARQANKVLPLIQEDGMHTAILSGPGEFSIMLDAGIPLNIESGRASFSLPVPAAGSAQLFLEIPGEHANAKINPGLITRRLTDSGKTIVEATLVPGQPANIWWATREIAAPSAPRELRFLSDIKTLVSISEADMRLAVLSNITVIQGEPSQFEVDIPAGFEMTGVTGATLESEEIQSGRLVLKTNGTEKKNHQFLISLEKPISTTKADVPFLGFKGAQRETGEVLVEGEGTMELSSTEGGTLKRMDLKEVNAYLRSLARHPLHAAFRYHRQPSEPPSLALSWNRFPDSSVLAAAAEKAEVTTLVTSEGRSLTEVKLLVKNQAQPFLKVELPSGASIVTADVAGQTVKPLQGADGMRVPMLRPGFRPSGPYQITYVIMHAGAPFAQKGDSELGLPKMDIPISIMKWEVFLPERYKVKDFRGDAISTTLLPPQMQSPEFNTQTPIGRTDLPLLPGQLGGTIVDPMGAVIPNAKVTVTYKQTGRVFTTLSNNMGRWIIPNLPSGEIKIAAEMAGFKTLVHNIFYDSTSTLQLNLKLEVGTVSESVMVMAAPANESLPRNEINKKAEIVENQASANVLNLQRRVAGVLPIRVDVPHTGTSYSFVRPLVLDEETKVTFRYKSK
jgi:hypothetical protein